MLAEEWEHIKQIFDAALHLPEAERSSYVEKACADQPLQISIVKELLGDHVGAGRFLETVTVKIRPVFSADELVAGRFRIVRLLGHGGMGEVYEAFDERLRVRVALKTLRPELTADPNALERFRREILIARDVSHESVCKIFDLVEHTDSTTGTHVPCLTMQLVQGESLLNFLRSRRPLPAHDALPLIQQMASAIDTLHAHGIIHRDLKPSNIMLTQRNGQMLAVVTDFGLAKPVGVGESSFFESQVEAQAGAPYFMAPELLRDGRPDISSDIYSFGLIMDEMVTATHAFPSESLHGLYYQKLWDQPIAPTARCAGLDPKWDDVILRCLSADPALRYEHAADAVADLHLETPVTAQKPEPASRMRGAFLRCVAFLHRYRLRIPLTLGIALLLLAACLPLVRSFLPPTETSVVVFPIENLTNRHELDYLCRGIGSEVMRRLTLIDGLQVIPFYESRSKTKIDQLKGQFSLEGLVQATGDRIRLSAQLTENRDGALVWSQVFESDIQNLLELQSDLAQGSVGALQRRSVLGGSFAASDLAVGFSNPLLRIFGVRKTAVPHAATTDPVAFDYYLRGQHLFEDRTVPAALDAIKCYQFALQQDPHFALAEAALADVQFVLAEYEYEPIEILVARARGYAQDAIRLDPNLAEPYAALASVQQSEWNFTRAEQSFKTAIRLNPKFARGHRWYGGLLIQFARFDESLAEVRRSIDQDPYDYPARSNYGLFLNYARRYNDAVAEFEQILQRKDLINTHRDLGDTYFELALQSSGTKRTDYFAKAIHQADLVEAAVRKSLERAPSANRPTSIRHADRMHAEYYTLSGNPAKAEPYLSRIVADTTAGRISPVTLAWVYSTTGQADQAINLLERAAQHMDRQLLFLRVAPQFDNLRNNPKFQALLAKMHLL